MNFIQTSHHFYRQELYTSLLSFTKMKCIVFVLNYLTNSKDPDEMYTMQYFIKVYSVCRNTKQSPEIETYHSLDALTCHPLEYIMDIPVLSWDKPSVQKGLSLFPASHYFCCLLFLLLILLGSLYYNQYRPRSDCTL